MKHIKFLGLLILTIAVQIAFVSTASATKLTSPEGTTLGVGTKIEGTFGHINMTGTLNFTCAASSFEGRVTNAGGSFPTTNVSGNIEYLFFLECGNHTVDVKKAGSFSIERIGENRGTFRSTGMELTLVTHSVLIGTVHCIYVTNNTHLGTITGGSFPSLSISSAPIPRVSTNFACGQELLLEGGYSIVAPVPLFID
jgi:hypothetical protein